MAWLILGLGLWSGAHLFKRLAPETRARLGEPFKGVVSVLLVLSIVLMVVGYRGWTDGAVFWGPTPATVGINNLLVLVAFYLFAASGMKTWVARRWRHPQLTAVILWAGAHLLVNGDARGLVLFGGLGLWAVAAIALIEWRAPRWTPPAGPGSAGREIGAAVGALAVYLIAGQIHGWLGPWPFGAV
ncbi:NnrU family protein [Rubellimicrobium sp. CFH 75288]|uniref:NnrU family protein n=1 Tax=Rubellimicrobium sp. CFH 75288 TaxID=2697034 RepID=UPI001411F5FA|nr:NnrU family protein [Rubellimicrobium sp. CFH 75288]NAZ36639.1 hypothetical protein [Rubellimicrobium sp. CFH 75288]